MAYKLILAFLIMILAFALDLTYLPVPAKEIFAVYVLGTAFISSLIWPLASVTLL
ncbi:hypothetical protein [Methanobrevibacter sp.]|uniref:hypothetical protein n=1 Tax=Methanobrevibacter sp. TaxID=66852 RepID=UPI00388D4EAA